MKITMTGRGIELTDGLKTAVEDGLKKLDRYFTDDTTAHVTMSVDKSGKRIEVTIPMKKNIIRSEQTSDDMYVSIDLVEEAIEDQLKKYRHKLIDKYQAGGYLRNEFLEAEDEEEEEDEGVKIVRTKRFGLKPMYPEDACVQMDMLGHTFFVFRNAESDEVNVVYRRKDGSYGLIEPDF